MEYFKASGGYTPEFIQSRLQMWLDAEAAVATGQSYKIGSRELKRADLSMIRDQIEWWERKLAESTGKGGARRAFRVVPRDL